MCIHVRVEIKKKEKKTHEQIEKQVTHADKYAQSGTHTHDISTCTSPNTQLDTHNVSWGYFRPPK